MDYSKKMKLNIQDIQDPSRDVYGFYLWPATEWCHRPPPTCCPARDLAYMEDTWAPVTHHEATMSGNDRNKFQMMGC